MSGSNYIHIVILFTILYYISLNKNHFGGAVPQEHRKENEAWRSDFNTDFEKHEGEPFPAEKGVVMQPAWLQNGKVETKVDTNFLTSTKELEEAKVLRAEIQQAANDDDTNVDGNSDHVQDLIEEFRMKQSGKDALETMVRVTEKLEKEKLPESVGVTHNVSDDDKDGPNIVEASATLEPEIDIRKLQRLEVSKRRTKEVLVLESVEEDYSFDLGSDVDEWEHILHDGEEYFIGRRQMDLLIVRKDAAKYQPGKVVQVGQPISYLETYSYWNLEQRQQEGVMLVASNDKVLWYVGDNSTGEIEFYWEWVVGNTISGLTYFTAESNEYLAVSSNESSRKGYYTLNIYQFELHTKEFWISQRLQLKHPCGEVTILDTGRDIILAVAQNNTAAIYGFNPHADATDHIRFQLRRSIESEGVALIAGFQMGGRSYLALGGQQPQILLYQQGDFVPKTILGHNFGLVELFFPIPVRTYRDDLILLVQHHVDFGTHGLTVLETLIWDGEAFEASIPVRCQMGQQTVFGVSCMLDLQRDAGLKGAALLRRGDEVSIIVPRQNAESGLFRLQTQLLAKNSELLDLQTIYSFLKDWVKEQDDLTAQALAFLNMPDAAIAQSQPDFSGLESIKTTELIFDGDVAEIHLNDYKWTDEDTQTTLDIIMNTLQQLESELTKTRLRRDIFPNEITFDSLEFNIIQANEVLVNNVNSEEFFIQNAALAFDGILNLQNLQILGEVRTRESRETIVDNLVIRGDIEFLEINGVSWSAVIDNMMFRNMPLKLEKLEVVGEFKVEDRLTVNVLNSLNFPDEYLWSSGAAPSIVKAEKTFTGSLAVNSINTNGTINGINPTDAITLSELQDWEGLPTFAILEVSGKLELNGTAYARNFDSIPNNPTLQESKILKAICNFHNLEVHGNIYLNGNFDKTPMMPLLANVVQYPINAYKDFLISSKKIFSSVTFPVDFSVADNEINEINVTKFVPKHTKQDLNISSLEGYILFNNLTLMGLYDSVNIHELLENSIRMDERQLFAETQLNFVDAFYANTVNVAKSLNGIPIVEGYQTTKDDLVLANAHFEILKVRVIDIPSGVVGNAQFNGLNIHEFLQKRNWSSDTGADTGDIHFDELVLQSGFESDEIHGFESEELLKFLQHVNDIPEMILDGKIQVDRVIVTEEVQINKLNGCHFDEDVQFTAIWLNRPNYLSTNLHFVEPLHIYGYLVVDGAYNDLNLPYLINDMVFRTANSSTLILAPKNFLKDIKILDDTVIEAINSIPFVEIATKQTIGNYKGSFHLNGFLGVSVLDVTGYFNEHSMPELNSLVHFDTNLLAFVQQGVTSLMAQMQLEDLTVFGNINEAAKLGDLFGSFIFKNDICILKGKNTFTGRVSFERGAYIRSLNGYNLLALLNNIVFIHDADTIIIRAPIRFEDHVNAIYITSEGSIATSNLNGCSLKEWRTATLRVDQPQEIPKYLPFSAESINGNLFYVSFLNNIDLSKLITLHTVQNLSSNLRFSELYLDGKIVTNGLTNGFDLQFEYANTFLTYGGQHVLTPLTMQSIKVLNNLQTNTAVNNDKDLRQLALLKGNIEFESPLFFQEVSTRNLQTNDFVSGINLNGWFQNSVLLNEQSQQWITGNWSVGSLALKTGPSLPSNLVDGMPPMAGFKSFMRTPRDSVNGDDELCHQVAQLISQNQNGAYFVKHLQESFTVDVKEKPERSRRIKQAFVLENDKSNYLLINIGCDSYIYEWNISRQKYVFRNTIESGSIAQFILIRSDKRNSNLEFVINTEDLEEMNCTFKGLSTWHFNTSSNMSSSRSIAHNVSSIHYSRESPSKLYAIENRILHEISFNQSSRNIVLNLPKTSSNDSYRFIPHKFNTDIMLINDENIILLKSTMRRKRSSSKQVSRPITYQPFASLSESILKPNASVTRKFHFSDFKHVVENILTDLIYSLHLEVNITQLSIPESDLYDEHLTEDFLAILEELQKQQLFSNGMFAEINLEKLPSPANTAQVLAARVVQIIWPAVVEIEEVHKYLRGSQTYEDSICTCITNNLGFILRDVLLLAYTNESNDTQNIDNKLIAVIERIYKFHSDLEAIATEMQLEIKEELAETTNNFVVAAPHQSETSNTVLRSNESLKSNDSWLIFSNAHLPCCKNYEVLSLQVGFPFAPRTLFAITSQTSPHLVAGQHENVIELYADVLSGSLLQSIPAHKPRSLTSVRIRNETLLVYIEGCCSIHVLIYRGVQGFVKFSKFKSDVEVIKVIGLSLLTENLNTKYYLATVLEEKLIFYEIAVAGSKDLSKTYIVCN